MNTINLNEFNKLQAEITAEYAERGLELTSDEIDQYAYERYKEIHQPASIKPDWRPVESRNILGVNVALWQVALEGQPLDKRKRAVLKVNHQAIKEGTGKELLPLFNRFVASYGNPHTVRRRPKKAQ